MPPGGRAASPGRSDSGPGSELFVKKRKREKKNDFSKEAQVPKHHSLSALSQGAVLQKPFSIAWDFASDFPCQCRKYYRLQRPVSSSAFAQHSRLDCCQGRKRCWSSMFSHLGRQFGACTRPQADQGLWLYVVYLFGASVSSSAKWVCLETSSKKRWVSYMAQHLFS